MKNEKFPKKFKCRESSAVSVNEEVDNQTVRKNLISIKHLGALLKMWLEAMTQHTESRTEQLCCKDLVA